MPGGVKQFDDKHYNVIRCGHINMTATVVVSCCCHSIIVSDILMSIADVVCIRVKVSKIRIPLTENDDSSHNFSHNDIVVTSSHKA